MIVLILNIGEHLIMKTAKDKKIEGTKGLTYKVKCPCGNLYVTCTEKDNKLDGVFVKLGKAGGCGSAVNEAVGRLISQYVQLGGSTEVIIKTLRGISCQQAGGDTASCISAIADVLIEHITTADEVEK